MSSSFNFDFRTGKRYRYTLEIIRDMLLIASVKVRKTRIMYQANLSYRLMEKYLGRLLESDLIRCHDDACYLITEKGKEFLRIYEEYTVRHKKIREEIRAVGKEKSLLENMCFSNQRYSRIILSSKSDS